MNLSVWLLPPLLLSGLDSVRRRTADQQQWQREWGRHAAGRLILLCLLLWDRQDRQPQEGREEGREGAGGALGEQGEALKEVGGKLLIFQSVVYQRGEAWPLGAGWRG